MRVVYLLPAELLLIHPGLVVELPSFSVSPCQLPPAPDSLDSGYLTFSLADKLLLCGGWRSGQSYIDIQR